jgi:hypothetical protein
MSAQFFFPLERLVKRGLQRSFLDLKNNLFLAQTVLYSAFRIYIYISEVTPRPRQNLYSAPCSWHTGLEHLGINQERVDEAQRRLTKL